MNLAAQKGKRVAADAVSHGMGLRSNEGTPSRAVAKAINVEVDEDEDEEETQENRHGQSRERPVMKSSHSKNSRSDRSEDKRTSRQEDSWVIDDGLDDSESQEEPNHNHRKNLQEKKVVHQRQNPKEVRKRDEVTEDIGSGISTQIQRRARGNPLENNHEVLGRSKETAVASGDEYEEVNAEEDEEEEEEEDEEEEEETATQGKTRPQVRERAKSDKEGYENVDRQETGRQRQDQLKIPRSNTEAGEIEGRGGGEGGEGRGGRGNQLPQRIMQGRKWTEQDEVDDDANSEQDESKPPASFTGRSTLFESSPDSATSRSDRPGDHASAVGESVNVVIRVRPINNQETQRRDRSILTFPGNGAIVVEQTTAAAKSFAYNVVFEPSSTQEDVFEYSGIKKLVDMAINGYSCTAFAFGQTGSGKTYTMTGPPEQNANAFLTSEVKGLIPRSFYYLFDQLAKRPNLGCRLTASYLEIYNEQVRDLLNPNPKTHLAVRWSSHKGFYVENLFVVECETIDDLTAVLEEGIRNRVMGSNSVNEHSSRSHSMLTLHIDSEMQDNDDDNLFITKRGKLTFVDLAGSERTKSDGITKQGHLQESNNINKSLLVLGNCISALGDLKKKHGHVPYRDSKLTKLLSDSLRGNGVTLMIACVSPSSFNSNETMNTLRYASRARHIKAKPIIIMDPREKFILSLKREIKILRQENHYLRHQLDFPVKPKGQLQKENDTKFLQMLKDQRRDGRTTEHGLYEMLQEYMIENEMLRDENSELHQVREIGRREQQMLSRENEKLMKKVETKQRNGVVVNSPSLYGESSSLRSYGLDSISSTPMQSPAGPRGSMAGQGVTWKQGSGGKRSGFPSQPKKPPHHLTEPVTKLVNLGPSPTHQKTMALNRRSLDSLTTPELQEAMDDSWQGSRTARLPDVKHGSPRRIDDVHFEPSDRDMSSRRFPTESQVQLNARLRRELVNLENEIRRQSNLLDTKLASNRNVFVKR